MSHAKLGCDIDLGVVRIGGPGLGNHLFPWARFVVATRGYGLRPIAPTWLQIKQGPILRRENDLRMYAGLFVTPSEYVTGWRRLWMLQAWPRYREQDLYEGRLEGVAKGIVVFRGMRGGFRPFVAEHRLIRDEIVRLARPQHLTGLSRRERSIVLHIRRGDFRVPRSEHELRSGRANVQVPLAWFTGVVGRLREQLGEETAIEVYSDGTAEELKGLDELGEWRRCHFGSALADLLAMSTATVLVRSGSTFSMWASFLGRMPTICYPGHLQDRLHDETAAEIEYLPDTALPKSFIRLVEQRIGSA